MYLNQTSSNLGLVSSVCLHSWNRDSLLRAWFDHFDARAGDVGDCVTALRVACSCLVQVGGSRRHLRARRIVMTGAGIVAEAALLCWWAPHALKQG